MEQFKKAKVVMLPTNEKTNIINTNQGLLYNSNDYIGINQHLYIISDEEKKEDDWCINTGGNIKDSFPFRVTKEVMNNKFIKKIIATTNTSLEIKNELWSAYQGRYEADKLPQPSKQFIEKYIEEYNKGNIITNVLVEYEEWCNCNGSIKMRKHLRTTKCDKCIEWDELKINPKDNTITIKKVKDSWNREEVENLIYSAMKDRCYTTIAEWKKWIEENL